MGKKAAAQGNLSPFSRNNPHINTLPAKLIYLNFHPPEVVSRNRDTKLQVAENYSYLFNFIPLKLWIAVARHSCKRVKISNIKIGTLAVKQFFFMLDQCWFKVGPALEKLAQHEPSIG